LSHYNASLKQNPLIDGWGGPWGRTPVWFCTPLPHGGQWWRDRKEQEATDALTMSTSQYLSLVWSTLNVN